VAETRAIVRVRGLSKQFLQPRQEGRFRPNDSLKEALVEAIGTPFRRARGAPRLAPIWALQDVSFDVMPGEVIGIIGANGAGKSTLMKILSRVLEPTRGRAELYGRVASLLEIGTGFHPDLTGRENVYLNGAILGMTRREIDARFDEIVAFAQAEPYLEMPVKRYSSGMYVRLAFAVAAHLDHEILIVDEVLAVGDAAFQKKCLQKFEEITRSGRTVLFVSHALPTVARRCERVIFLTGGRVHTIGPAADVVRLYRSLESSDT
jgi:lipopolysaccharide transport system ATP-binding protein